ncbi:MAG: alpha-ketoglutaric semialdehyde dehydrogenase [Gemmatimonadales bacterium]|jgi:aldehyde dehydrogenase (NAD+)|nr:alpha-ketoglutaric semialdehyde dehydrogenase [Gemmatimonadales bacterium]
MGSTELGLPTLVLNLVDGVERPAAAGECFSKLSPGTGRALCSVARSRAADVEAAVAAARRASVAWAAATPVHRGDLLRDLAFAMRDHREDLAYLVHTETGKSLKDSRGETAAAIEMGFFVAGEGRRFYGRTTTSAVPNKTAQTIRQPLGVAGLIIAANTPIANVAWKVFPALLCGNAAVLKPSEDTPVTAWAFARLATTIGLPPGVLNVVHGYGEEAGGPLVESPDVDVVSFTGSTSVGRWIQQVAGARLAKVCLELGGKNPIIVCEDADLELAANWAILSAFSNAGQRCAAGSRIIVFEQVYDRFRKLLLERISRLRVGMGDEDDFGPVINEQQLNNMLAAVKAATHDGAALLSGGKRLTGSGYDGGFYMAPTLLEGAGPNDPVSRTELFGPISSVYRVADFEAAIALANHSPYGLTAAIHTADIHRAMVFTARIRAGVAVVNGGTYGSEPHLPFGGVGASGNGWREAGTEALDVYSDWKTVYINYDPSAV